MATPFHIFRKNQRIMLAVLGVMCMFAFVFLPIFSDFMDTRVTAEDGLVVETRFGDLKESQIDRLRARREIMNNFVSECFRLAFGFPRYPQFFGGSDEESVVESWILTNKAKELGVEVTDKAVNDFIRALTQDRVRSDDLRQILAQMQINSATLFAGLREELMARTVIQTTLDLQSALGDPPAQRWDYYRRLNQRATIEWAAVPVSSLVAQAPEPSSEEVQAFYEQHKNQYFQPGSPEPGFHLPYRAKFSYLKAAYEAFVKPDDVTAEEVEAHYEKFKDTRYRKIAGLDDLQLDTGSKPVAAPPPETPSETPAEGTPAVPTEEASPEIATPPSNEPATETPTTPAETPTAPSEPSVNEPAPSTEPSAPAEAPQAEAPPVAPSEPPAEPQAGRARGRLLVLAQDSAETPTETSASETPAADAPAEQPSADAAAEPAAQAAAQPTPTERAVEQPSAQAAPSGADATSNPSADSAETAPATDKPIGDDLLPAESLRDDSPYEPLENVEPSIRRELAAEKASERMAASLKQARRRVSDYFQEREKWRAAGEQGSPPAPPDLAQLATENGLSAHQTELISAIEAASGTDLGRSAVEGGDLFSRAAFSPDFKPYISRMSQDGDGNQYLFWKTEDAEDRVPPLDEVREQVVAAWKFDQARQLARKRADELAESARQQVGKPLAECFTGQDVTVSQTRPFSWLVIDGPQSFSPNTPPRLSEVEGIDQPGSAFMQAVFSLNESQVGVAANEPQSVYYVVRLLRTEPNQRVLQSTFMADNFRRYAAAAVADEVDLHNRWRRQIKAEAEVQWEREPIAPTE